MPTVPTYDYPTVSPEAPPDVRGYATDRAFGVGVGSAITGVGGEIAKTGDMLSRHAITLMDRENQATADIKSSEYVIAQSQLDSEHRSLEGKARSDAFPKYIENSRKLREQFRGTISNVDAQRLFDNDTRRYFAYSVRNEAYGVGTELKKYNTSANQLILRTAGQSVMGDPYNDEVFSDAETRSRRAVSQQADNLGWSPEERTEKEKAAISNLQISRISAIARDNPERAVETYQKNKEKILPSDRAEVESKILSGRQQVGSEAALKSYGVEQATKSDIQSIMETGEKIHDLSFEQVKAHLGDKKAVEWENRREQAFVVYNNTHDAATLTQAGMIRRLDEIAPRGADRDYDRKLETFSSVQKYYNERLALRANDPAGSVSDDPAVKAAIQGADNPTGMRVLMDARMAAQERAGIELRSPITKEEALELVAPMKRALPGKEREALEGIIKTAQNKYGDRWQDAYVYALRAEKINAETARVAGALLRRAVEGSLGTDMVMPSGEAAAAEQTVNGVDPFGGEFSGGIYTPEQPPVTKKEPLSRRILEAK